MRPAVPHIDPYIAHLDRTGKRPNTVLAYCRDVIHFGAWFLSTTGRSFHPQAVDPRDIGEYRSYLLQRNRKPATINRSLIALKRYFDWALREELITDSPFEILERFLVKEQSDTAPRWLTYREQRALVRAVREGRSRRDMAIVQTLLGTGLRVSELAALQIQDLTIKERSGRLTVRQGKGGKARTVPLDNRTRYALAGYLEERQNHPHGQRQRLFLGQRGPIRQRAISYVVEKYAYNARLENLSPHTLRHSFAKNLVDTGTPLDQVATLLGHERLDTVRIYTRPSEADLERAVRRAAGEIL